MTAMYDVDSGNWQAIDMLSSESGEQIAAAKFDGLPSKYERDSLFLSPLHLVGWGRTTPRLTFTKSGVLSVFTMPAYMMLFC